MTPTTDQRIPRASLREEWSVSSVQRLAWAMGRPAASPAAARARAAAEPAASLAERTLAAARVAALQQAC